VTMFRNRRFAAVAASSLIALAWSADARGEWEAPKDGVVTEKQFNAYVAAFKEYAGYLRAAGKAMEGSKTGIGSLAVLSQVDEKTKAILAKHGLTQEEFGWLGTQVWQAWGEAVMAEMLEKSEQDMVDQQKATDEKIAAQEKVVQQQEAAKKSGTRLLSDEQRQQAVEQLKSEREAALEEAKQYDEAARAKEDSVKEAQAEVDAAAKEAKDLEAEAKRPPADVEDKEAFAEEKRAAAADAKERAKDGEARVAEAKQAQAEERKQAADARARADALAKRMEKPEAAASDEDKAAAAQEADAAVTAARREIDSLKEAKQFLAEAIEQQKKTRSTQQSTVPAANVTLMRKHRAEFEGMLKAMDGK